MEGGCGLTVIKKLLIFLSTSIVLIYFIFPFVFKSIYISKLNSESQIYESSLGPIEYKIRPRHTKTPCKEKSELL